MFYLSMTWKLLVLEFLFQLEEEDGEWILHSTVARSFFLFLWMQLKSAFFFFNTILFYSNSQSCDIYIVVSVFNSVTRHHIHPKWHNVHTKDPKSKTVLNQDSVSVKSRLQVSSNSFVNSYVYDPCATTGKIDMTCIVSNTQRLTHIFTSQQFK